MNVHFQQPFTESAYTEAKKKEAEAAQKKSRKQPAPKQNDTFTSAPGKHPVLEEPVLDANLSCSAEPLTSQATEIDLAGNMLFSAVNSRAENYMEANFPAGSQPLLVNLYKSASEPLATVIPELHPSSHRYSELQAACSAAQPEISPVARDSEDTVDSMKGSSRSSSPATPNEDSRFQAQHESPASDTHCCYLDQEWEVDKIIGEETKDGKLYYMVKWMPCLVAEDDMRNATEAVRDWQKIKSKIKARAKRTSESKYDARKGRKRVGKVKKSV
ncbi:hypothetical protein MY4038_010369 [Beauveria bassiana]